MLERLGVPDTPPSSVNLPTASGQGSVLAARTSAGGDGRGSHHVACASEGRAGLPGPRCTRLSMVEIKGEAVQAALLGVQTRNPAGQATANLQLSGGRSFLWYQVLSGFS